MPSLKLPYHNSIPYHLSAIWLASFCYYVLAIMWLFAAMSSSQLRRDNSFLVVATSAATDSSPRSLCSTAAAHPSFNQPTPTLQELDIGLEAVVADPSYDILLGLLIDMLERSLALLGDIRRPVAHLRVRYDPRHVVQHYVRVQTQGRPDAPTQSVASAPRLWCLAGRCIPDRIWSHGHMGTYSCPLCSVLIDCATANPCCNCSRSLLSGDSSAICSLVPLSCPGFPPYFTPFRPFLFRLGCVWLVFPLPFYYSFYIYPRLITIMVRSAGTSPAFPAVDG